MRVDIPRLSAFIAVCMLATPLHPTPARADDKAANPVGHVFPGAQPLSHQAPPAVQPATEPAAIPAGQPAGPEPSASQPPAAESEHEQPVTAEADDPEQVAARQQQEASGHYSVATHYLNK